MTYYTHSGLFHCDEVAGYAITKLAGVCQPFSRLTDIQNLPTDGLIADIGREYNPAKNRFDHHQELIKRGNGYPLASAGLLWRHFGYYAVFNIIGGEETDEHKELIEKIVKRVDVSLIQSIDAHDADSNYSVKFTCSAGPVRGLTLPNIISILNNTNVKDHDAQDMWFMYVANLIERIIIESVRSAAKHFENTEKFEQVATFINNNIIVLSESVHWKEIVHEKYPETLFVVSPSMHPGNPYSLTAVPVEPDSRDIKQPIERPEWFSGFIHNGKWIAGGDSVETMINLAEFNNIKHLQETIL